MLCIGIAAESLSEAALVSELGDRVILDLALWLDGQLDLGRRWTGLGQAPYLDLHRANEEARNRGVAKHGHFGGEPGATDAMMVRNLLALFADEDEPPGVVVVARDTDEELDRIEGFRQAVRDTGWPFVAVSAHAHPEREAWLLAAFEPSDTRERSALDALRQELGFDPTVRPHELRSGRETAKRDAKRILSRLCSQEEAARRLIGADLGRLRARGQTCGLGPFLDELQTAVAPELGARVSP